MKLSYCAIILISAVLLFLSALTLPATDVLSSNTAVVTDQAVVEFERRHSMCAVVLMKARNGEIVYVYNRHAVFEQRFPPGSIAKAWSALVLIDHRKLMDFDEQKKFRCPGRYYPAFPMSFVTSDFAIFNLPADKSGRKYFRCSLRGGHGDVSLKEALIYSCNAYFLNAVSHNASEFFCLLVNTFFLNRNTGALLVRDRECGSRIDFRRASLFQLAAAAIGEGGLIRVSPLKVAQLYAAVFSGGVMMPVPFERPFDPEPPVRLDVSGSSRRFVYSALKDVVKSGTMKKLCEEKYRVNICAGKTGTATRYQEKYVTHGWNVLHLKLNGEEFVLVTFVEKGSGGGEALELSRIILRSL